jgi:predicted phosphoribosyltransferase
LFAIGAWYQHFEQLEDEDVNRLLARANLRELTSGEEPSGSVR